MSDAARRVEPLRLQEMADRIRSRHEHVAVGDVNDHRMTLAVNEDVFPWHRHPDSDELFLVLEGELRLEFRDAPAVELGPMDTCVIPAGVVHRTLPRGRCVNAVVETAGAATVFEEK